MTLQAKVDKIMYYIRNGAGTKAPVVIHLLYDPEVTEFISKPRNGCQMLGCEENCGIWHNPFHWAAAHGRADLVVELLRCGADVNSLFCGIKCHFTALDFAIIRNKPEIIRLLLTYGANIDIKGCSVHSNFEEKTSLELAKMLARQECVKILEDFQNNPVCLQGVRRTHRSEMKVLSLQLKDIKNRSKCLGRGCFGKVWKFDHPDLDEPVALKEFLDEMQGEELKAWREEIYMMFSVDHPNLVKCLGYCTIDESGLGIFMELCQGNLSDVMGREMTYQEVISITLQIGQGLHCLHSKNKIHRDLKPENILVQSKKKELTGKDLRTESIADLQFKIGDFGFCRNVKDLNVHTMTALGNETYTAPEIWDRQNYKEKFTGRGRHDVRYGASADIFSFGKMGQELLAQSLIPEQDSSLKSMCDEMFNQCCKITPSERPSSDEIVKTLTALDAMPLLSKICKMNIETQCKEDQHN